MAFTLGAILKPSYVLIPKASWVSYEPQALINSHKPLWLKTKQKNSYKLDQVLEKALLDLKEDKTKNTPLLFLNSPNNPTGAVYTKKELEDITNICKNIEFSYYLTVSTLIKRFQ